MDSTEQDKYDKEINRLNKIINDLSLYFTSGNSIPVERATILAKDFWRIVESLPKEVS